MEVNHYANSINEQYYIGQCPEKQLRPAKQRCEVRFFYEETNVDDPYPYPCLLPHRMHITGCYGYDTSFSVAERYTFGFARHIVDRNTFCYTKPDVIQNSHAVADTSGFAAADTLSF